VRFHGREEMQLTPGTSDLVLARWRRLKASVLQPT
jgi:hypothetical protein